MHAIADVSLHHTQAALERVRRVVGGDLLDARLVRRLDRVSFLGALDAQPDAGARSTRFEHAIAVAALGCDVAADLDLDPRDTALLVAACLLHDVGHYPLSHSTERAFARIAGADHHQQTKSIVLGQADASESVVQGLTAMDVVPSDVWALISGAGAREDGLNRLLTGSINLDTLDGIVRTASTFGIPAPSIGALVHRFEGRIWLRPTAIERCDEFWRLKNTVYQRVVERPSNILAEAELCRRVETIRTKLPEFAALDDHWLRDVLGELLPPPSALVKLETLHAVIDHEQPGVIVQRTLKRYSVNEAIEPMNSGLPIEKWGERYRHDRRPGYVIRTAGAMS